MRMAFVQEAALAMEAMPTPVRRGAAVTKALCGRWEFTWHHEPPCPLAPHHGTVSRVGDGIRLRVLFAVEPELESTVRRRIEAALSDGRLVGHEGEVVWTMTSSGRAEMTADERTHAEHLVRE